MTWVSSSVQWFLTTLIIIIKLDKSVLLSDEWMSLKENSSYRTVEILWVFFFTTKAMNFFEKKEMKCQTKAFPHSPWRIKKVVEGHLEEWFHSRSWSVKWKSLTFTHVRLYATPWTIPSVECLPLEPTPLYRPRWWDLWRWTSVSSPEQGDQSLQARP